MKKFMSLLIVLTLVAGFAATMAMAAPPAGGGVDYEGNLALVPPADPEPTDAPKLLPAMVGKHPRLLFTSEEIELLKKQAETDEVLKAAVDGVVSWSKRIKVPVQQKPAVVTGDGPALTQSVGQWAMLAYGYNLEKSDNAREAIVNILTMMLNEPHWADTAELDSNMGAGNNMLMVALLYDAVYEDLEPELRKQLAAKILTHVRRMHYLGYQQKALMPIKYWQQDPANNHRWHRGAGMAASLIAIADEEGVESRYMLQELRKEMDFLIKWYPHDGDCHEGSSYQVFGFNYLAMAARIMDRNIGTQYLKAPGFANAWAQQIYYRAPGRKGYMTFGDAPNNERPFQHLDSAFFLSPALSRDKNVQAALLNYYKFTNNGRHPWTMLTWYDPTVGLGDYKAIPTYRIFPDLGAVTMRDSWESDAVLMTFKCGPYAGYKLNEYRHTVLDENGNPHYINIAHDDPDANSFALGTDGEFLFHPGNYATNKVTRTHSTITLGQKGQKGEGDAYTQPVNGVDMRDLSYLVSWKVGEQGRIIVEGEAGNAYDDLELFRRTAIWMPGEYILLLDDVRARGQQKITWRGTCEKAQFENPEDGRCYAYTKKGKRVDFQMLANREFNGSIDFMMLVGRWTQLLMHQFQFSLDSQDVRFACLMDPWKKKVSMTMKEEAGGVTLKVTGDGINDTWTWKPAGDLKTPASITCTRDGKELITLTEKDKAPQGDAE